MEYIFLMLKKGQTLKVEKNESQTEVTTKNFKGKTRNYYKKIFSFLFKYCVK